MRAGVIGVFEGGGTEGSHWDESEGFKLCLEGDEFFFELGDSLSFFFFAFEFLD